MTSQVPQQEVAPETGIGVAGGDAAAVVEERASWAPLAAGSILIIGATLLAYLPALRAGFVWDDGEHFSENPLMTAPGGLWKIWTQHNFYYPLTSTSFWFMRRIWGLEPLPYHLTNMILHGVNSILLWRIVRRLGMPLAFLSGVLFAVHPVHAQSVAWATELKNTQSGFFYLLSVACFVSYFNSRKNWAYGLSLGFFFLALLSKTSTVTLPFAVALVHLWLGGGVNRRAMVRLAPYFVISLVMGLVTVLLHREQVSALRDWDESLGQRFLLAARCVWFYLGKLAWPSALIFVYPRWELASGLPLWIIPMAGAVGLVLGIIFIRNESTRRASVFGLAYFAASLLPVLNFFKMFYTRYAYTADHWQYLADMGMIPLGVALAVGMARRFGSGAGEGSGWGFARAGACMLCALLGILSFRQCEDYRDLRTLWVNTIGKNPKAWLAHVNLAMGLAAEHKADQASYHFNQALKARADIPEPYIGLSFVEVEQGEMGRAEDLLLKALKLQPGNVEAMSNLAGVYFSMKRMDEAMALLRRALELKPDNVNARVVLGRIEEQAGRTEEAVRSFEEAIELDPAHPSAEQYLGELLAKLGRPADAIRHLLRALEIDSKNLAAMLALGGIYGNAGRGDQAVAIFRRAVETAPDNAWAHYNLGVALLQTGREVEGNAEIETAERINPGLLRELEKGAVR